jgi:hypothetical protein
MKYLAVCACTLLAASAPLAGQFSVPQLGIAHFSDGSVHQIQGVPANLIVDPQALTTADVVSFCDSAGLTSSNGLIHLVKPNGTVMGEYRSSEPLPILNIDAGAQSAAAWLPSKHLLLRWDGTQFAETPVDDSSFAGRVMFMRLTSNTTAEFFVVQAEAQVARISVALPSGRLTSADLEPGAHGWVFAQQNWIFSQDSRGLVAERPNGLRQTVQLSQQALAADDLTLERMSDHWLHIYSRSIGTNWALYLDSTKLNLFFLPPPVTETAR